MEIETFPENVLNEQNDIPFSSKRCEKAINKTETLIFLVLLVGNGTDNRIFPTTTRNKKKKETKFSKHFYRC